MKVLVGLDGDSNPIGRLLLGGMDGREGVGAFREIDDGALCKCLLKLGGVWIFASNLSGNRFEGKVAVVNYRMFMCE